MPVSVWVVIPTYNEAQNLAPLVRAAAATLEATMSGDFRLLVVDDNSPDGTGRIADRLASEMEALEVLHRAGKSGLGQAYLAGFERALSGGAELVVQMDADFSHDPRYLPALIAATRQGAEVAIGSRYVPGGGVRNWGLLRRFISRGGGLYARAILQVPVNDLTAGFKCITRAALERIELGSVRSEGYVFQVEITYRAIVAGLTVREIPIIFTDRTEGASKMSTSIALEAMWRVPRLRATAPAAVARVAGPPQKTTH